MATKYVFNGSSFVNLTGLRFIPSTAAGTSADAGQVTATASATPHTAGAWVQVVTSTTADASAVEISLRTASGANTVETSTLLDIGIGGAGAESVLVASVPVGYRALGRTVTIPCPIPSGSRVAVRVQSVVASKAVDLTAVLLSGPTVSASVGMGANTATSRGVTLGASSGPTSFGAWTEITASTAAAYQALIAGPQGAGDTGFIASGLRLQIGTGAAAAEVAVAESWWALNISEQMIPSTGPLIPVSIPAGTRLSARYASNSGNLCDLIIHGVPA